LDLIGVNLGKELFFSCVIIVGESSLERCLFKGQSEIEKRSRRRTGGPGVQYILMNPLAKV
jgi:hypothetical protein